MYRTEVSFGKKLGRLTLGAVQEPPKARSRPAANLPPVGGADAPLPARVLLDDLRAKMDAILSRAPVTRAPATLDAPELPFVTEVTALGDLHRRVVRFPLSHRVGHKSVGPAHSADAELLALLALDPSIARASPAGALYLDTETTGLAGGAGTVAFLVGLAFFDEGALVVEQLLVRALGEEAPMLEHVRKRVLGASMLVSFNGKSFDMPLLRTRFVMARTTAPPEPAHLDLVHVARRIHKRRGFPCRLVTIEERVLEALGMHIPHSQPAPGPVSRKFVVPPPSARQPSRRGRANCPGAGPTWRGSRGHWRGGTGGPVGGAQTLRRRTQSQGGRPGAVGTQPRGRPDADSRCLPAIPSRGFGGGLAGT